VLMLINKVVNGVLAKAPFPVPVLSFLANCPPLTELQN
jgi:hypothetical protein